jgi:mono/diheme cytochrome c family protein
LAPPALDRAVEVELKSLGEGDMRSSLVLACFGVAAAVGAALTVIGATVAQTTPDLDQNWQPQDRAQWYSLSQGSRLLPLSWFEALEQPDATGMFLDNDFIAGFRYIPRSTPAGVQLPLGFVPDQTDPANLADPPLPTSTNLKWKIGQGPTEAWVGMNCSACHTAEITYTRPEGKVDMIVDGGPTLADFESFITALDRALTQTASQPDKFDRFAKRVLGPEDSTANRALLMTALNRLIARQAEVERMNAIPGGPHYGFGRLDAFGNIFNKVAIAAHATNAQPNPSDAPVSYPFLWNVPQQQFVQWNGIAPNNPAPLGALARNSGEVLGVFADVSPQGRGLFSAPGYVSSVKVDNLATLEGELSRLRPPAWPTSVFGPANPSDPKHLAQVYRGYQLYQANCASCHDLLDRTDLQSQIPIRMLLFKGPHAPGTDPWMACNAYTYTAKTGVLEGTPNAYLIGDRMGATAPVVDLLRTTVVAVLWRQGQSVLSVSAREIFGQPQARPVQLGVVNLNLFGGPQVLPASASKADRLTRCMTETNDNLGYKARPLNGIWATAPYLHNGSVPTLYDLLLPPDQRPTSFYVGTREFDPVKVGFVTTPGPDNSFLYQTRDAQGQIIPGNSNAGHDYGNAQFSDDDRWAIVEYLKTL